MTVSEFVQAHPEQVPLMDDFNARVKASGKRCKQSAARTVQIAFIYPGLQVSDYWRRSISSFKKRMDEIGISYSIKEYYSKPVVDQGLQSQQIEEALESDPDYLVFTLDVFKHKEIIERILYRKRPKLILQNVTTPLKEWEGRQPFMYVGFDHAIGSRMLADYYMNKFGGKGQYGLLYYSKGYVSTMRGDTFQRAIAENSEIRLRASAYTDGKINDAYTAATEFLENYDLDFLYTCATDIAIGAIQALEASGKSDSVLVNGWGGGSTELDAIMDGMLDVTVMRMNDDNGVAMAEAVCLDATGRGDMVPTIFSGEMALVEKGISREALDTLIRKAFRYSGP